MRGYLNVLLFVLFSMFYPLLAPLRFIKTKTSPKFLWDSFAVRTGLEPVTPCVTGMYSNQLN